MARITITTDGCEVIDYFDVTSGNFATPMSKASLLEDLKGAVELAEKIQAEEEEEDAV